MANLKFYETEKELFPKERELYIHQIDTLKLCRKLAKHFNFKFNGVSFRKIKCLGLAHCSNNTLTLRRDENSLLTVCHELAHLWQFQENKQFHTKKMLRKIKRLIQYCYKNKSIVYIIDCNN